MHITVEYLFANESARSLKILSRTEALVAIQNYPWAEQLAFFNHNDSGVGPEVRFTRYPDSQELPESIEAYACVLKNENDTWLIVAGANITGKFLGLFSTTKKADIIMDELSWQQVQDFVVRFYEDSRADLFAWMKERE